MRYGFLLLFTLCLSATAFGQVSYSGNVLDATDKSYMEGVLVEIIGSSRVDTTNVRGHFSVNATQGDTLKVSFPGFIDQKILLGTERFLQIQLQDKARLLPTFEVKSKPSSFRFKDGKLVLIDPDEERVKSNTSGISAGYLDSPNLTGGVAIAGVLSSLTKRARLERKYNAKKEWMSRREGYYAVIESDSIRQNFMIKYDLNRSEWDQLIIRFNEGNNYHEFLDWSKSRVFSTLDEFIMREYQWLN